MSTIVLTPNEAYLAMFTFLQNYWERGHSSEVGALLGSLSLLPDGKPADAAVTSDWNEAVRAALSGTADINLKISR
jgi:hypothetical protein